MNQEEFEAKIMEIRNRHFQKLSLLKRKMTILNLYLNQLNMSMSTDKNFGMPEICRLH